MVKMETIKRICGCTGKHQVFNLEETHIGKIACCTNCGDRYVHTKYPDNEGMELDEFMKDNMEQELLRNEHTD